MSGDGRSVWNPASSEVAFFCRSIRDFDSPAMPFPSDESVGNFQGLQIRSRSAKRHIGWSKSHFSDSAAKFRSVPCRIRLVLQPKVSGQPRFCSAHFQGRRKGPAKLDRQQVKSESTGVALGSKNEGVNISPGIRSSSAGMGSGPLAFLRLLFCATFCCALVSCDSASPQVTFQRGVLNCNMIADFAGRGLARQLESPSEKLTNAKTGATAPIKRKEVVDDKIAFVEESLAKVRKLRQTGDTKDIVQASIALHEYVLPVYRNEYQQLAKLYDGGAAKAEIDGLASAISTKYGPGVAVLFDRLTTAGKAYAAKHDIKVRWDVRTSPAN